MHKQELRFSARCNGKTASQVRKRLTKAVRKIAGERGDVQVRYRNGAALTSSVVLHAGGANDTEAVRLARLRFLTKKVTDHCVSEGWIPGTEEKASPALQAPPSVFAPSQVRDCFGKIYGRDKHIEVLLRAWQATVQSGFRQRFHCLLYGPPASGKTEIAHAFVRLVGEGNVLRLDSTSTSKAGAENVLLKADEIPSAIVIEELEKTEEEALRWLLGLMDQRGEISKTNAVVGNVQRSARSFCVATCNDFEKLGKFLSGALLSRFAHKIHCPRPGRDLLRRIVARDVEAANGDPAWINPAIDFCMTHEGTDDPRRIIAVCLTGREKLLTGEFQAILRATTMPASDSAQGP